MDFFQWARNERNALFVPRWNRPRSLGNVHHLTTTDGARQEAQKDISTGKTESHSFFVHLFKAGLLSDMRNSTQKQGHIWA